MLPLSPSPRQSQLRRLGAPGQWGRRGTQAASYRMLCALMGVAVGTRRRHMPPSGPPHPLQLTVAGGGNCASAPRRAVGARETNSPSKTWRPRLDSPPQQSHLPPHVISRPAQSWPPRSFGNHARIGRSEDDPPSNETSTRTRTTVANETAESCRVAHVTSFPPPLLQGIRNPAPGVPPFPGGCRRWRRGRCGLRASRGGGGPGGVLAGTGSAPLSLRTW